MSLSPTSSSVIPSSRPGEQLRALRAHAGVLSLDETRWIEVTGSDRVRWLNGMVTNSVQALPSGEGAYSFVLSAQGRIQGDATIWAEADRLLLETDSSQVENLLALLDRFIIMDDVELRAVESAGMGLLIAGPEAASVLERAGLRVKASRLLKRSPHEWRGEQIFVANAYSPLVPRFELWMNTVQSAEAMRQVLLEAGAIPCGADALELLRVLEGTPRYGVDIRDKDLAQETAQTRALHFNKGCYLGQEIVERIRSRGAVHRTFTGFVAHGAVPSAGTTLEAEGRKAGELTTVAAQEIDGQQLAMGYIRREVLERGLPVTYEGGAVEARSGANQVRSGASEARTDAGAS